jgi:chemotaxis protein methyltransferase CheR
VSGHPRSLGELVEELGRRTGLRTHTGRVDALRRVFDEHVAAADEASADRDEPALMDALVDAAAIDESYFFRHGEQLRYLRSAVLPRLLAERPDGHTLRIWSAGCADGEEPYTVAVILHEEGLADRAEVLATDVSAGALARARTATYTPWSLRSAEVAARSHLFEPAGRRQRLTSAVTDQVVFRQHNLLDPAYPRPDAAAGFDVILCRNVLVHLEPEAVATVIPRLAAALAPGGWLVTAPADPPALDVAGADLLEPVVLPAGGLVYRRADGPPRPTPEQRAGPTTRRRSPTTVPRARPMSERAPAVRGRPAPETASPADVDGRGRCLEARRLLGEGRPGEAFREAQAAAFLEPDLPAAHLTLALAASAADRRAVAGRAFRRAAELLDGLPADDPVELCDGETAGRLAELARAHALLAREAGS